MAWYQTFDYTPPASTQEGALGSVGGGWTDVGTAWSRSNSSNIFVYASPADAGGTPWNNKQLVRKASAEASINQKIQFRGLTYGPGSIWLIARYSAPNGDAANNCYIINSGQFASVVNGTLGAIQNGNGGDGVKNATEYDIEVTVTQTNSTTTTITQTTWVAPSNATSGAGFGTGALVSTNTYTDTAPALQNLSGGQGVFGYLGGQQSVFLDHFATFTDINPSGGTTTPPSGGGTTPPPATGGATLTLTGPSTVLSPYNWTTGLSGDAARTWHTGAYARFYVSGSTSGTINLGPCGAPAYASMQIDDNAWSTGFYVSSGQALAVNLPDTGVHVVTLMLIVIGQTTGRWDGSNAFTINSYVCGSGGVGAPAVRASRNVLMFGDSIWEGIQADNGSDNYLYDTVFFLGEAYRRMGYEYGNVSCGYSGYSVPVPTNAGGTPAAFVPGNDGASAWNKLDGTGGKRTMGSGSAERFYPVPDIILDEWGTNDGLQNANSGTFQASVAGLYAALRAAAPNAYLLKVIPYGGYKRADILAALASLPVDSKRQVIDLAIDQRQADYGGVHPGRTGHAQIAPMIMAKAFAAVGGAAPGNSGVARRWVHS